MHRAKKTKQANQLKRRFYVKITKYGYVLYNSAFFRASLEHFHSRCNPGTEALATFLAGKVALSETTWITVTVKML
jgi:hypothetical protein